MMCFSPPVMLATFLIEFGFFFYVLWRYKMTAITRLTAAMLFFLGTFQLAEYMICGGLGLTHIEWARLGYISITLLPALGIHLVMRLAGKSSKLLLTAAYGTAAMYALYFAFAASAVVGQTCAANYAVFDTQGFGSTLYAIYYYGWLLVTAGLATYYARVVPKKASALRWMVGGYAAFIVPTTFANLVDPTTIQAIPSIMCGFAVLLAFVLVGKIMPLSKTPVIRQIGASKKHRTA